MSESAVGTVTAKGKQLVEHAKEYGEGVVADLKNIPDEDWANARQEITEVFEQFAADFVYANEAIAGSWIARAAEAEKYAR